MDNYQELIERLNEDIIADAFHDKRIMSGVLAERLIRERKNAADAIEALQARVSELEDKVDGLDSDLSSAVNVAWHRGAHEWVRLNYPSTYEQLTKNSVPS